tara:strand:- start:1203 stop:1532 length:330 start_codon:yes stop_codon:yes gene_type:complete
MNNFVPMTQLYEIATDSRFTTLGGREKITTSNRYTLRTVYVNAAHVLTLKEATKEKEKLEKGLLPEGLRKEQEFTRIQLSTASNYGSLSMIVVGPISAIAAKLSGENNA